MRASGALPGREDEGGFGELFDLAFVEPKGAVAGEGIHELIEKGLEDEHLFFSNAEEIVIVSSAENDALGGLFEATGAVHKDGRIAGTCANRPFPTLHGCLDDAGSAGDAEEFDVFVLANGVEGFECWGCDKAGDILDAEFAMDRLIKDPQCGGGAACSTGMRVKDCSIAGSDHGDDVARHGRDGMGGRCDGADDAKRRKFLESNAVITAKAQRVEELDTRHDRQAPELFNLVIEPADLGLIKFKSPPLLRIGHGELLDDPNHLDAARHALGGQLQEGFLRGCAGFVRVFEDTEPAATGVARDPRWATARGIGRWVTVGGLSTATMVLVPGRNCVGSLSSTSCGRSRSSLRPFIDGSFLVETIDPSTRARNMGSDGWTGHGLSDGGRGQTARSRIDD
jgi:hypothetical protein